MTRIALYPDPLLAQVLTASTYSDQIFEIRAYSLVPGRILGPGQQSPLIQIEGELFGRATWPSKSEADLKEAEEEHVFDPWRQCFKPERPRLSQT